MVSGWVVNRRDGISFIISELKYKEFKRVNGEFNIDSEEHWFDINAAKKRYFHLEVVE